MTQASPKDTTDAKFIKYFNDKTVVFNNQDYYWFDAPHDTWL